MEWDYLLNTIHDPKPSTQLSWAIASSEGFTSPICVDTGGLCTAVFILHGSKYWCVGNPAQDTQNPKSITAYDDFNPMEAESSLKWEGVQLRKQTVL